jgi:peroxiredoxin (alkyl hydroperoxide reductase subunit C)
MLVGQKAPDFKATAAVKGDFKDVSLSDFKGKYVLMFFYPLDFTFVCPTELMAFQNKLSEFKNRNTEVIGCSVDSQFTHAAWTSTPNNKGGIEGVEYPLLADVGGHISKKYGVLAGEFENEDESYTPANVSYRGMFLIDKKGIVRAQVITDEPVGRNVDEALRLVDALQFFEENGTVCPANWQKGDQGLKKTQKDLGEYLSK